MLNYIKAEKFKCRRTFGKKNIYIAPITVLLLAFYPHCGIKLVHLIGGIY